MAYDPTIQGLLAQTDDDWGNPLERRKNLVPYGIPAIDQATYGLDIINGELINIMGPQKGRKTTFAVNILANIMTIKHPEVKPTVMIDTLESGMQPKRYRDTLLTNIASRWLIQDGHTPGRACPKCSSPRCKELVLNPDYLLYNTRSPAQQAAIDYAKNVMYGWPLLVYGPSPEEGDTRNLSSSVKDVDSRWRKAVKNDGVKIIITDHVQQYAFEDEPTDYEKQIRAVSAISNIVARMGVVVLMLSQVSLSSVKESRQFTGKLNAAGGTKLQQEANVTFATSYNQEDSGHMKIEIMESRKSGLVVVHQPLEEISGTFYDKGNIN